MTANGLIEFCKEQFCRYGVPEILVSDSGTQIISKTLKEFSNQWKVKVVSSSPHNHQSNGKAESAVKIAKRLIKKVRENHEDLYAALLEWRNTPVEDIGASPVQLLMSRATRSFLPVMENMLKPRVEEGIVDKLKMKQDKYKAQYDRGTMTLSAMQVGQRVTVQKRPDLKSEPWVKGSVVTQEGPRTYIVSVDGRLYRRNRRFIRVLSE